MMNPPSIGSRSILASRPAGVRTSSGTTRRSALRFGTDGLLPMIGPSFSPGHGCGEFSWQIHDSLGRQAFGQALAGGAQPHMYRRGIDFQYVRDLVGVVIQGVTQRQDLAVRRRQLLQLGAELPERLLPFE